LARKTICFSKDALVHDKVIGLLSNKVEFGIDVHAEIQVSPTTDARFIKKLSRILVSTTSRSG
jgi:hypothetical protein